MTKPMGSERSVILFLLNFLLLWQLGTGTTSTTIDDSIKEVVCNGTYILPEYEVCALRLLAQNLVSSSTQLSLSSSSLSSSTQLSLSYPICSDNLFAEIKCGSPDNTKNGSFPICSDNQYAEIECGSPYNTKNGSFRSVTEINLPGKKLDGSIHYSIGHFKNLERLNLYNNQLSGGIPSTLGQLQHLKYLYLSSNSLTGSIPPSLTMLRNLESLDLSSNDLDGTIPSNLKGLQSLRILYLSQNKLTGPIPDSIRYCTNLTVFYADRNFLSGYYKRKFGHTLFTYISVSYIHYTSITRGLFYNSLSGRIPKELGELSALQYLALDGNDLHGELPKELGNLTNLRILYLTANNFNGTIPTTYEQKRFIICRGIAKGLKYLHERKPPIIHRNIKANNILLDASCNPKISDFGLAKLYEEENPYIAIAAGGDLLYMSPEYATRRAMTVKVDVYSFGILLLEIVSGRNNADYRANQETVFLLDTAGNLNARGRLGDLVDPSLRTYDWDQAKIVLNLAMMCTDQSPSLRPTMSQVVAVLEGEKTLEDLSKEIAPST